MTMSLKCCSQSTFTQSSAFFFVVVVVYCSVDRPWTFLNKQHQVLFLSLSLNMYSIITASLYVAPFFVCFTRYYSALSLHNIHNL